MRLKLERLRDNVEIGVSGVSGVSANNGAGSRRNTCEGDGVSGVSLSPSMRHFETPETPASFAVFHVMPNVYAGETPETPETPKSSISAQDPAFWEDDWSLWALAECLFRARCLWRIEALLDRFCDWCKARDLVPCMAETFAALLDSEGFTVTAGLVCGLALKDEYMSLTRAERKAKEVQAWNGN